MAKMVFAPPDGICKLGISDRALRGEHPLNGLRHPPAHFGK
jgi:hypothetical protein